MNEDDTHLIRQAHIHDESTKKSELGVTTEPSSHGNGVTLTCDLVHAHPSQVVFGGIVSTVLFSVGFLGVNASTAVKRRFGDGFACA